MPERHREPVSAEKLFHELGIVRVNRHIAERIGLHDRSEGKKEIPLSYWRENAAPAAALMAYLRDITDEKSPDYIPPEYRIAVSDMDGTLFCETDPTFFDFRLFYYRVMADPGYKDIASEDVRKIARTLEEYVDTGIMPPGFEVAIGNGIAQVFAGMTVAEFEDYVHEFANRPARGYDGMKAGEAFYRPMLQVLDLLKENGFVVFICSGTDRQVVRGLAGPGLDLPHRQVLGTEEVLVARDQGGTDGTEYVFSVQDEVIFGGRIQGKNLKMNKVSVIAQEIGQQPVLCFGNSAGDISMANYVTAGNRYKNLVFMLCCDDLERERGNLEKAAAMEQECRKNGWIPISMKNDWKTIYGDGVTRKTL